MSRKINVLEPKENATKIEFLNQSSLNKYYNAPVLSPTTPSLPTIAKMMPTTPWYSIAPIPSPTTPTLPAIAKMKPTTP